MPRPISTATLRPDLGAVAFEYAAEKSREEFIADRLLPIFNSPVQSTEYPVINSEAFMKLYETKRQPRSNYNRSDYTFGSDTFSCAEQGWEEAIDDVESNLYGRYFDLESVATNRAVDVLLRRREKRVADKLFSTANISNGAVTVAWSEPAACKPRSDVQTALKAVRDVTGQIPNALTISWTLFNRVLLCSEFNEATKHVVSVLTLPFEQQVALVAKYFGVDQLFVGRSAYDSAKKGQSTVVTDIWDSTKALICRVAANPQDLKEPCIGRTFLWTGDSPDILTTETYREEGKRGNVVRVRHNIDECFVFEACGYLLTGL